LKKIHDGIQKYWICTCSNGGVYILTLVSNNQKIVGSTGDYSWLGGGSLRKDYQPKHWQQVSQVVNLKRWCYLRGKSLWTLPHE
jgi:hypothetical protein